MTDASDAGAPDAALAVVFAAEGPKVLASLIRYSRNFDLAEEALGDALATAAAKWPTDGAPENPAAWLMTTAKRRLIDRVRSRGMRNEREAMADAGTASPDAYEEATESDLLRLIFTCCHPALSLEARVALTLRTVAGLNTAEIAAAFLVPHATMAQRLVRAKKKITTAGIAYEVPTAEDLPTRLPAVLSTVYLVFSAGYDAAERDEVRAGDLSTSAINLARMLHLLMPTEAETLGLLALLLLTEARRFARFDDDGALVLLDEQDRRRWNAGYRSEGLRLVARAPSVGEVGQYWIQAALAAQHMGPASPDERNWAEIVSLYDLLLHQTRNAPIVAMNRALAVSSRDGAAAALAELDQLSDALDAYPLFHAARAAQLTDLNRTDEAITALERSHSLTSTGPRRNAIEEQLATLRD